MPNMTNQDHSMSKQELRQLMKERVSSLTRKQKEASSRNACRILQDALPPEHFDALLCYYPLKTEISPLGVAHTFLEQGKTVSLPRTDVASHKMDFFTLDPRLTLQQQVARGAFGVAEPEGGTRFSLHDLPSGAAVLLVAPGLAFDKSGSRLGRGAGFYDRAIAQLRGEAALCGVGLVVCGFCFALQLLQSVPTDEHDEVMDAVVCDEGAYIVRNPQLEATPATSGRLIHLQRKLSHKRCPRWRG